MYFDISIDSKKKLLEFLMQVLFICLKSIVNILIIMSITHKYALYSHNNYDKKEFAPHT